MEPEPERVVVGSATVDVNELVRISSGSTLVPVWAELTEVAVVFPVGKAIGIEMLNVPVGSASEAVRLEATLVAADPVWDAVPVEDGDTGVDVGADSVSVPEAVPEAVPVAERVVPVAERVPVGTALEDGAVDVGSALLLSESRDESGKLRTGVPVEAVADADRVAVWDGTVDSDVTVGSDSDADADLEAVPVGAAPEDEALEVGSALLPDNKSEVSGRLMTGVPVVLAADPDADADMRIPPQ
ncbi:hypothetical protein BN14_05432 [Rhizoctonia solani AG-1 IB]|uniref:Uncharacterized protein n=1 Tax=Thanatephorus cucumeris (strain AG1-IB / isolate 7/3/14) TaxID=1108050 RepID=M5BW16_THACB|nr:hypothetical protein BN14_05432 [Rhizoctonia solani AG-1 IB]